MGIAIIKLPFWDGLHLLFMGILGGGLLYPQTGFCLRWSFWLFLALAKRPLGDLYVDLAILWGIYMWIWL